MAAIKIGDIKIGDGSFVIIGGPCAVENREQFLSAARFVKEAGANILRGNVYKPRTSPYSFQGTSEMGLKYIYEAKMETGLPTVCEILDANLIEKTEKYVDMFQIGARNMQNFPLLRAVGQSNKPVILKRGLCSTIDEWLNAAEYIKSEGNNNVILCERGIRTYETSTRNTLDLSAVPVIKSKTDMPIIVDPSHAVGVREYVAPLAKAAVAAGADGVMIETHPNPESALSDGHQSLNPDEFKTLCSDIKKLANFLGFELI